MIKVPKEARNGQEVRLPAGFAQLQKVVGDGQQAERERPGANILS